MKKDKLDDIVVCRCEGTTVQQIRRSISEDGAVSVNAVKKITRAGMGICQGRTCARTVELILLREAQLREGTEPYQSRPPVRPVLLANLSEMAGSFTEPEGPVSVVMLRRPQEGNPDPDDGPPEGNP
jgi:hypothetical protein